MALGNNNASGFNPVKIAQAIKSIKEAYKATAEVLTTGVQTQFVNEMKNAWACPLAQKFFTESFKPTMDSLSDNNDSILESVVTTINGAATAWAKLQQAVFTENRFEKVSKRIDVSGIQAKIGDLVGIDKTSAESIYKKFHQQVTEASSKLDIAVNAVQDCGFLGGQQQSNLIASLKKIKQNMSSAMNEIDTSLKAYIEQTIKDYSDTEGAIAKAFTAAES
jgi:hypothetical protein